MDQLCSELPEKIGKAVVDFQCIGKRNATDKNDTSGSANGFGSTYRMTLRTSQANRTVLAELC
jgi:hypothetical protein